MSVTTFRPCRALVCTTIGGRADFLVKDRGLYQHYQRRGQKVQRKRSETEKRFVNNDAGVECEC
jgi:hypothetical protein